MGSKWYLPKARRRRSSSLITKRFLLMSQPEARNGGSVPKYSFRITFCTAIANSLWMSSPRCFLTCLCDSASVSRPSTLYAVEFWCPTACFVYIEALTCIMRKLRWSAVSLRLALSVAYTDDKANWKEGRQWCVLHAAAHSATLPQHPRGNQNERQATPIGVFSGNNIHGGSLVT
jgi:hypothetical protein